MDLYNNGEFRYTRYQQKGGHCIHDPIKYDTDPKDEKEVTGMESGSIIYIHFPLLFAIIFTYHDVKTCILNLLTMGARKSTY